MPGCCACFPSLHTIRVTEAGGGRRGRGRGGLDALGQGAKFAAKSCQFQHCLAMIRCTHERLEFEVMVIGGYGADAGQSTEVLSVQAWGTFRPPTLVHAVIIAASGQEQ